MKKKSPNKKNAIATFLHSAENEGPTEGLTLSQLAANHEAEGFELIDDGMTYESEIDEFGLPGLVGVICASTSMGFNKRRQIVEQMQIAAPRLSGKFCRQLLDLLTGTNPDRHVVQVSRHGEYRTFDMT